MKPNAVTVDSSLRLRAYANDGKGTSVVAQLDRISAQQLAQALLEFTGAKTKSFGRGNQVSVSADCSMQTLQDRFDALQRAGGKR